MTYKVPGFPSDQAYKEEIADFWEIEALRNPGQFISKTHISRVLAVGFDEIDHQGIESEDDKLDSRLDEVLIELGRRQLFTSGKHPFILDNSSIKLFEEDSVYREVYLFMLLCTRFRMNESKKQNGLDGTKLFEELCAEVASSYFGDVSDSFVFGTANPGNFQQKVEDLIHKIGEGKGFTNPNKNSPTKNDDAVDIVAWKDFADKRIGKMIAFGQCKTGTSWRDSINHLDPLKFCGSWFEEFPIYTPLSIVFLCDTLFEDMNFYTDQFDYLVFNRFRIVEYVENDLDNNILDRIKIWLSGAISELGVQQ